MGDKIIINGFIKPFSDNEQLSEVGNGKIPLPARWQFGVFGGPKKAYAGFPVWVGQNDNLSLLAALKADFPTNWEAFRQICRTMLSKYREILEALKGNTREKPTSVLGIK